MPVLTKREELISTELNRFRDFVIRRKEDISNCSFDVQSGFYSYVDKNSDTLVNVPDGRKDVKACVSFDPSHSEGERNDVIETIEVFVKTIQKGLSERKIDVSRFITNLDIDNYIQLEIGYRWTTGSRKNQNESLTNTIDSYEQVVTDGED